MKRNYVALNSGLVLLLMWLVMSSAAFGETDPRGAMPAPPGTAATALYYRHISGNEQYNNGKCVSKDYDYKANISILRPAYWNKVFGFDYNVNLLLPFGEKELNKHGGIHQSASGLGDPQLVLAFWPVANHEQGIYLQPAVYLTMPLGDYENDRSINMGANRWAVKPELDFTWKYKDWVIEFMANAEFYSDNDEHGIDNLTSEKDPAYQLGSHVTYTINKSFWAGVSGWWTWGGRTCINGIKSNDDVSTGTGMLSLNYQITENWALLAQYAHDFDVENGPSVDQTRIRLFYRW